MITLKIIASFYLWPLFCNTFPHCCCERNKQLIFHFERSVSEPFFMPGVVFRPPPISLLFPQHLLFFIFFFSFLDIYLNTLMCLFARNMKIQRAFLYFAFFFPSFFRLVPCSSLPFSRRLHRWSPVPNKKTTIFFLFLSYFSAKFRLPDRPLKIDVYYFIFTAGCALKTPLWRLRRQEVHPFRGGVCGAGCSLSFPSFHEF